MNGAAARLPARLPAILPDLSHEKSRAGGASERWRAVIIVRYDLTGDFPPFPAPSALRTGKEGGSEGLPKSKSYLHCARGAAKCQLHATGKWITFCRRADSATFIDNP